MNTYNVSIKMRMKTEGKQEVCIPTKVLRDRTLKVLEAIVEYLKEKKGYNYHEIGKLLNRDERTIWTVHNRSKKKREKQ